jgi:D-alanyl-D-alanine dipeptidase
MIKIKKTLLGLLMTLVINPVAFSLDETASAGWKNFMLPPEITNNILYLSISHSDVKKIPIENLVEKLIDLNKIKNPRMRAYSSIDLTHKDAYDDYSKVRYGLYKGLVAMLDKLPPDVGIAYSEGLRPLDMQKEYFDNKLKETLLTIKDKELAYQETSKFVSPFIDNTPTHCTGAAIDMSLFRVVKGKPELLDMGKFDVTTGVNNQSETFSQNTTPAQRVNRLLLLKAATEVGLVNYGWEWWHYSYGDKAWAYVKGEKKAKYGLAVNKDNPILGIDKKAYLKNF